MEPDLIASIDEMNGQYQRYRKEQEIMQQTPGNAFVLSEISKETRKQSEKYSKQRQNDPTQEFDNTTLSILNLPTDGPRSSSTYRI